MPGGAGPYRAGRTFENRVADALKGQGYCCVRSAGSSGPFDVVAMRPGETLLIQAKRGGQMSAPEWNGLYHLAEVLCHTALLAEAGETVEHVRFWRLTGERGARGKRAAGNLPREPWEPTP